MRGNGERCQPSRAKITPADLKLCNCPTNVVGISRFPDGCTEFSKRIRRSNSAVRFVIRLEWLYLHILNRVFSRLARLRRVPFFPPLNSNPKIMIMAPWFRGADVETFLIRCHAVSWRFPCATVQTTRGRKTGYEKSLN